MELAETLKKVRVDMYPPDPVLSRFASTTDSRMIQGPSQYLEDSKKAEQVCRGAPRVCM